MRFQLVDRVLEICYDKYIIGVKCITLADDVFDQHFPGYPIFPGTLIMEGLAQLSGSYLELIMKEHNYPVKRSVLSIVNHMKFKRPVYPGDRLIYKAEVKTFRVNEFGVTKVTATIDDEIVAQGEMFFNFFDIPNKRLEDSRQELYDIFLRDVKFVKEEKNTEL